MAHLRKSRYLLLEALDLYPNPQRQTLERNPQYGGKMVVDLFKTAAESEACDEPRQVLTFVRCRTTSFGQRCSALAAC